MKVEELQKASVTLDAEIKKIKNALIQLETDIAISQTGDENGPFWSGPGAYVFVKTCLGHIDHDKFLVKELEKCTSYLNSIEKK